MKDFSSLFTIGDRALWVCLGATVAYGSRSIFDSKKSSKTTLESGVDKLVEACDKCRASIIRHHDSNYTGDAKGDLKVIQRYKDATFSKFKAVRCYLRKKDVEKFEAEYYKWIDGVFKFPLSSDKRVKQDAQVYLNQVNSPHDTYCEYLNTFKMLVSQNKVKVKGNLSL